MTNHTLSCKFDQNQMTNNLLLFEEAEPRSLVDRRVDSYSIRFLTAVVRTSLGSHV